MLQVIRIHSKTLDPKDWNGEEGADNPFLQGIDLSKKKEYQNFVKLHERDAIKDKFEKHCDAEVKARAKKNKGL